MQLIIFDIDGTLTDTNHVDEHAIVGALQDVLGLSDLSTDWSTYEHSTDSGIVKEVITRVHGSVPPHILQRVQDKFFEYLEAFFSTSPDLFRALPGGETILRDLDALGYATAIATGSWRESALFKLRVARIWKESIPMATSDDSVSRSEIIDTAIQRAKQRFEVENFESVRYVGDGVWDARASRRLGLPFIGVGGGHKMSRLMDEGATAVVEDLTQLLALVAAH
jgi:phosphoglycolate phosphatase-like HAD superfamily hydrolase